MPGEVEKSAPRRFPEIGCVDTIRSPFLSFHPGLILEPDLPHHVPGNEHYWDNGFSISYTKGNAKLASMHIPILPL